MRFAMKIISMFAVTVILFSCVLGCNANNSINVIDSDNSKVTESVLSVPEKVEDESAEVKLAESEQTEENPFVESEQIEEKPSGKVQIIYPDPVNYDSNPYAFLNYINQPYLYNENGEKINTEFTMKSLSEDSFEETLNAEEPAAMFMAIGSEEVVKHSDICLDLKNTEIYKNLINSDLALVEGDEVKGVPLAFGSDVHCILYNKKILNKYFEMDNAKAKSVDDLNSFEAFKNVVEDIQSKKDKLGIKGAFTSSGLDPSSSWRFTSGLASMPIYYEYKQNSILYTDQIKGTYLSDYKSVWDMYINNSTVSPGELAEKTGDDSIFEFIEGEAVFYQSSPYVYQDLASEGWNEENVGVLPIFFGESKDLSAEVFHGREIYACINKNAPEEDIQAAIDYLDFITSDSRCVDEMAKYYKTYFSYLIIPYKAFADVDPEFEYPVTEDVWSFFENGGSVIGHCIDTIPSEQWKDNLCSALIEYSAGGSWSGVEKAFVDGWNQGIDE